MAHQTPTTLRSEAILRLPITEAFAYLNDLANHVGLSKGVFRDFRIISPASVGVGATASFKARNGGLRWQKYTIEISESLAPDIIVTHNIDPKAPFSYSATWRFKALGDEATAVVLSVDTSLGENAGRQPMVNSAILMSGPGPWMALGNTVALDTSYELLAGYAAFMENLRETFRTTGNAEGAGS